MFFDTHTHLHDREHFLEPDAEIDAARQQGVQRIMVVGVNPADWDVAISFAEKYPEVYAIAGWHPNYTAEYHPSSLARLEEVLTHPKVVALGEIGLDYYWDYSPRAVQYLALGEQLALADSTHKPVVFHAREAYADLLGILERRPPHPYLFHCFTGTREDARRAIQFNGLLGVDGPVTHKKAEDLRSVIAAAGLERLVLETDSPYMTPVPHRGQTNRPAYLPLIANAVAGIFATTPEEVGRRTTLTANRFFGLSDL